MTFRLYDTATRATREFEPVVPGSVSIYHCGLTVQAAPHLGHIRKEVVFDVLRRWLTWSGHTVTVIANITDIDDKILAKSAAEGVPWNAFDESTTPGLVTGAEASATAGKLGFEIDPAGPVTPATASEFLQGEHAATGKVIAELGIEPQ